MSKNIQHIPALPRHAGAARDAAAAARVGATVTATAAQTAPAAPAVADRRAGRQIAATLELLGGRLAPQRRIVHAGDTVFRSGQRFDKLHILNSGMVKIVTLSDDGREQVVGLKFRGDWLGFDGIAAGHHSCDAQAMDTGEVWAVGYDALLDACHEDRALMTALHAAMSREIVRDRESLLSVCTLPADARVAEFLRCWAESLADRGMRTDQFALRLTRAEIGNFLGLTLETVSRALSRLARDKVIGFASKGRRDVCIPDPAALSAFVQRCLAPSTALQ